MSPLEEATPPRLVRRSDLQHLDSSVGNPPWSFRRSTHGRKRHACVRMDPIDTEADAGRVWGAVEAFTRGAALIEFPPAGHLSGEVRPPMVMGVNRTRGLADPKQARVEHRAVADQGHSPESWLGTTVALSAHPFALTDLDSDGTTSSGNSSPNNREVR